MSQTSRSNARTSRCAKFFHPSRAGEAAATGFQHSRAPAESQRDSITQPRVDRNAELPWVIIPKNNSQPQRGCITRARRRRHALRLTEAWSADFPERGSVSRSNDRTSRRFNSSPRCSDWRSCCESQTRAPFAPSAPAACECVPTPFQSSS